MWNQSYVLVWCHKSVDFFFIRWHFFFARLWRLATSISSTMTECLCLIIDSGANSIDSASNYSMFSSAINMIRMEIKNDRLSIVPFCGICEILLPQSELIFSVNIVLLVNIGLASVGFIEFKFIKWSIKKWIRVKLIWLMLWRTLLYLSFYVYSFISVNSWIYELLNRTSFSNLLITGFLSFAFFLFDFLTAYIFFVGVGKSDTCRHRRRRNWVTHSLCHFVAWLIRYWPNRKKKEKEAEEKKKEN